MIRSGRIVPTAEEMLEPEDIGLLDIRRQRREAIADGDHARAETLRLAFCVKRRRALREDQS